MLVFVDTREQKSIEFPKSFRTALKVGDYTTEALKSNFVIERKSPQDLYGSIIQNHLRFRRMLQRAEESGIKVVVFVECLESEFYKKTWKGGNERLVHGKVLKKIIGTISRRYEIEFVWCSNRTVMANKMITRLRKEERNLKQ